MSTSSLTNSVDEDMQAAYQKNSTQIESASVRLC
jgi:hypothetical protein